MPHKRSSFESSNFYLLPLGMALMGFSGFVFSLMTSSHSWGILLPVILVPYVFWIVFSAIMFARMCKVRTQLAGFMVGMTLLSCYIFGELLGSSILEGIPITSWIATRWREGYELFGAGSFALKGILWILAYLLKLLILFFCITIAILMEGERQFCDLCRSHTTRLLWKGMFGRFHPKGVAHANAFNLLIALQTDPAGEHAMQTRVRTCKCKSLCELQAKTIKIENEHVGDTIIDAQPLTPLGVSRLLEWIVQIDPEAIDEATIERLALIGAERATFDQPIEPEGDEWKSIMRSGAMTAMEWYADTEYTQALRARLIKGDYRAIIEALSQSSNINDTACIYEASADWSDTPDWIDLWADDEPERSAAHCVRGINLVKRAWVKRGSGWEPKNYAEFQGLLGAAMGALDRATVLDPHNRVAHAWKIYAGKGLQLETEQIRSYFDAACTLGSDDPPGTERDMHAAHWMYMDAISPKWGGNEQMLLDFASECLKKYPNGSPSLAAVPFVHYELMGEAHDDGKAAVLAYLARGDVRAQIIEAHARAFKDHRTSMVTPRVRAIFAGMLWLTGELDLARSQLERMGRFTPWSPFVSSFFFFSKYKLSNARKACGL